MGRWLLSGKVPGAIPGKRKRTECVGPARPGGVGAGRQSDLPGKAGLPHANVATPSSGDLLQSCFLNDFIFLHDFIFTYLWETNEKS